jgi:hypothetical protein
LADIVYMIGSQIEINGPFMTIVESIGF